VNGATRLLAGLPFAGHHSHAVLHPEREWVMPYLTPLLVHGLAAGENAACEEAEGQNGHDNWIRVLHHG